MNKITIAMTIGLIFISVKSFAQSETAIIDINILSAPGGTPDGIGSDQTIATITALVTQCIGAKNAFELNITQNKTNQTLAVIPTGEAEEICPDQRDKEPVLIKLNTSELKPYKPIFVPYRGRLTK